MRTHVLIPVLYLAASLLLLAASPDLRAATEAAPPKPTLRPLGELLVERTVNRLRDPNFDPAQIDQELKVLEDYLVSREQQKTREIAQVRFMQVTIIITVKRDHARGLPLLERLAADFAGTEVGNEIAPHLRQLAGEAENLKRIAAMIGRPAPALAFSWCSDWFDTLEDVAGNVVVLDFWTTLETVPGRSYGQAFPALRSLVARYEKYDVVFLAVTSLQDGIHGLDEYIIRCDGEPEQEYDLMRQFIAKHNVTWSVAFTEEDVFNPRFGIRTIPYTVIIAPDGTIRRSGAFATLPVAERAKVIDELLREADLDTPDAE